MEPNSGLCRGERGMAENLSQITERDSLTRQDTTSDVDDRRERAVQSEHTISGGKDRLDFTPLGRQR
jgi:hypothetical protein